MALAKRDCDAQAAEEAFTSLRVAMQKTRGYEWPQPGEALPAIQAMAAIAQAHALEDIARELHDLADSARWLAHARGLPFNAGEEPGSTFDARG